MSGWVSETISRLLLSTKLHITRRIATVWFALYQEVDETASMTNDEIDFLKKHNMSRIRLGDRSKIVRRVLRGRSYLMRFTRNRLLTCPEVAAFCGWSLRWVYELLRRGDLKAFRRGGHRVIHAREVLRLKENVRRRRLGTARLTLFTKEGG
jgi:excisionase family DNA binding protein